MKCVRLSGHYVISSWPASLSQQLYIHELRFLLHLAKMCKMLCSCPGSTPTSCGDPGTPVFGTRIGEDFRIGATVYFECNTGYELDGPGSRQCLPSGVWSNRLPQCVDITESKCVKAHNHFTRRQMRYSIIYTCT